jgi:hypothetical protein
VAALADIPPFLRFASPPAPAPGDLPRMDVAGFAGLACAGPIGVPVPVESHGAFRAVFGGPVAIDGAPAGGGRLDAAVRAFFAEGGRRAWVLRCGDATTRATRLPLAGVAALIDGRVLQAELEARSPGTFADELALRCEHDATSIAVLATDALEASLELLVPPSAPIVAGDLLALPTLTGGRALCVAESAGPVDAHGHQAILTAPTPRLWLRAPVATDTTRPWRLAKRADVAPPGVDGVGAAPAGADGADAAAAGDVPVAVRIDADGSVAVTLPAGAAVPAAGTVLALTAGAETLLVVAGGAGGLEPGGAATTVQGAGVVVDPGGAPIALRGGLRLELTVTVLGDGARLERAGCHPLHPRWLGALLSDAVRWGEGGPRTPATAPLAGGPIADAVLLPLGLPGIPTDLPARPATGSALARNGCERPGPHLFVDERLESARIDQLAAELQALRTSAPPRGLHALTSIDELTLIAVPDAALAGTGAAPPRPALPVPAVAPDLPRASGFEACATAQAPVPALADVRRLDGGLVRVRITAPEGAIVVLEAFTDPADPGASGVELYRGAPAEVTVAQPAPVCWLRARTPASAWSPAIPVDARPAAAVEWDEAEGASALLAVQRALVRACAARGDVLAVLALPPDWEVPRALDHAAALRSERPAPSGAVPPLDGTELGGLGAAALSHPWPVAADGTALPADGVLAGQLAGRALTRGAWIAAAGTPVGGAVALSRTPRPGDGRRLEAGGINPVRSEPSGIAWTAQRTLADGLETRHVNVRRLIHLLRRAAIEHGEPAVFEPDGELVRRALQRRFEDLLGRLLERGAFAGATAAESYDVKVLAAGAREGQVVVELRVAPSLPLRFLTVELVLGERR